MTKISLKKENCYCGSNTSYSSCCEPVHQSHAAAETAERLMRSRYSAFVLENSTHILKTWHEPNRPASLNFEDHPVTWIKLEVHQSELGDVNDDTGTVSFSSTYMEKGQLCTLTERSNFVRTNRLWYYVDGVCDVIKKKVERNRPCPCGSGKKFKRCCCL